MAKRRELEALAVDLYDPKNNDESTSERVIARGRGMARLFRLLEKKRGARRTGSNLVGTVGEALFFGAMFLLGALALSAIIASQVNHPEPASYAIGLGFWLVVLVLGSFTAIGGGGLIWTVLHIGTSAERRNALARQAANLDLLHQAIPHPRDYPTLPTHDGITNSPGIELAYRLPPSQSPGWRLLAMTVFTLVSSGVGCALTVWAVKSHLLGKPEWFLTVFLAPYLGTVVWSVYYLVRLILIHTGMGPTTVEISDHPLLPGREYQVALLQAGQIHVKSLELALVCEEEATYHQGTDIRSEVRVVYRQTLLECSDFKIDPAVAFQQSCSVLIPPYAMHSFQSPHNSVQWKLIVKGKVARWPEFERGFAIVVYPGEATSQVDVVSSAGRGTRRQLQLVSPGPGVGA